MIGIFIGSLQLMNTGMQTKCVYMIIVHSWDTVCVSWLRCMRGRDTHYSSKGKEAGGEGKGGTLVRWEAAV